MPLEVHPAVESDFADFVRIQLDAFSTSILAHLAPNPPTPEYIQETVDKHVKCVRTEPDCHYLKVIDTDQGGKMIAGAKWRINENGQTEEQMQRMLPVPGEKEADRPLAQDIMWYLHRVRKEFMGTKPFYFLHVLVTDPKEQRRGAGAMLVNWGIEKADKVKLPSFLEASEAGRPLYEKLGFEPKHEEVIDMTKYGLEGRAINTVMIRPPRE